MKRIIILAGVLTLGLVLLAGCRQRPEEVELEKKELIPLEEMVPPEEMAEVASTPLPATGITPIGNITQASVGQRATLKATITSVRVFKEAKGRTLKISDGTGTIDVVIWKDLYNQIPQKDSLVKGTKIQVSGEIGSYRENLQIKPKSPGDIQISGAASAAPPAATPTVVPTTPAEPVSRKVDTDGDGIPDTYVLVPKKKPATRPAVTPTNKPTVVSADTIQITDITRFGKNEFTLMINGSLMIKGFKKMSGQKGEWVVMPGYQTKEGKYKDLVYPITRQARETINEGVLKGKKNPGAAGPIVVNEDKIKLYKSAYPGKTKAYGTMTINNSLTMKIKVLEGQYGPWVALPSKKGEDGRYYDVAYPVTPEATKIIKEAKDAILKKYETIK